ncbi:MAG: phosphoglycerate kinase [Patescibacteria group bacterium]
MRIKSLSALQNCRGKVVFLRLDLNVPFAAGKIRDDFKIIAALDTINFLRSRGARLVIATHLGEPQGPDAAYSVRPIARRLRSLLKCPAPFLPVAAGPLVQAAIKKLKPGGLVVLENLRFQEGEYANDLSFAKSLAAGMDLYVNDAFAVSHRCQASVAAIKKYLPSYAGLSLEKELRALGRILRPKKPLVVIMGGAKIKTKAPLLAKLRPAASRILVGGGLANNFFKFQGWEVGGSLVDDGSAAVVKKFFKGRQLDRKIILPLDVVVAGKNGRVRVVSPAAVKKSEQILDIGPSTIAAYAAFIKQAQTIIWNGPLGKFEEASFKHGTLAIAALIAARSSGRAYGVVGGGETVAALKLTKMSEYIDWISTAGGAMLAYLGGEPMPGLSQIVK